MTTVTAHQPGYLPYLGFFHKCAHSDIVVLLDDVEFEKNGYQNRNRIKNSQGWQWLTVPVLHRQNQLLSDVRINHDRQWARKHRQALSTNYQRARHFREYAPQLEEVLEQRWTHLAELNCALIRLFLKILSIPVRLTYSSQLRVDAKKTDRLVRICEQLGADQYLSGTGARDYLDPDAFAAADIALEWQRFECAPYSQVFPKTGFVENLSIVDALFSCGPDGLTSLLGEKRPMPAEEREIGMRQRVASPPIADVQRMPTPVTLLETREGV